MPIARKFKYYFGFAHGITGNRKMHTAAFIHCLRRLPLFTWEMQEGGSTVKRRVVCRGRGDRSEAKASVSAKLTSYSTFSISCSTATISRDGIVFLRDQRESKKVLQL